MGKPVVGVGGPLAGVPTLSIDDVRSPDWRPSTCSTLGHTAIAHIGGDKEFEMDFHLPTNRRLGYEEALEEAGIDRSTTSCSKPADFTIQGGFRAAKQLLGNPHKRPTAIFAASDEMAIGAILAAKRPRAGRAPRRLGRRHRRPQPQRVLRADHGRPVPRRCRANAPSRC